MRFQPRTLHETDSVIGGAPAPAAVPPADIKGEKVPPAPGTDPTKPAPDAGKGKPDASATVVPEKYDLKFKGDPDKTTLEGFTKLAKAAGLSNEHAQALVDFQTAMEAERHAAFDAWVAESLAESQKHPTLGGANFEGSRTAANQALAQFDPQGKVAALFIGSGLANRVELLEMFVAIHKATADDRVAGGSPYASGGGEKSLADRLFGKKE